MQPGEAPAPWPPSEDVRAPVRRRSVARRITGLPNGQHLAVPDPAGTLDDELARAVAHWRAVGTHTDVSLARLLETTAAFTRRLHAQGVATYTEVSPAHAAAFVSARTRHGAAPELATWHARRTALRTLFRTLRALGLHDSDPTLDLVLPPRGQLIARPLTDDEVGCAGPARRWAPGPGRRCGRWRGRWARPPRCPARSRRSASGTSTTRASPPPCCCPAPATSMPGAVSCRPGDAGFSAGSLRLWAAARHVTGFATLIDGASIAGIDPFTLHRHITRSRSGGLARGR
jgi:hypothetical protein